MAGLTVWGFTAMLLDRVLALGGFEQPWDSSRLTSLRADELPAGWPPLRACLMAFPDISGRITPASAGLAAL